MSTKLVGELSALNSSATYLTFLSISSLENFSFLKEMQYYHKHSYEDREHNFEKP
jgi:hypothetical protein